MSDQPAIRRILQAWQDQKRAQHRADVMAQLGYRILDAEQAREALDRLIAEVLEQADKPSESA